MPELQPIINAIYKASQSLPDNLLDDEQVNKTIARAIAVLRGEQ